MPTELEELVEFLHHGNTQIRQIATENLVGYSTSQPGLFKVNGLTPVKDLKLLVKDYTPIAKNALTILINLSTDELILQDLAQDDAFLESLLSRITNAKEPNANEIAMLLANLAKSDRLVRLFELKRAVPTGLSKSERAIDQLMDCFVKGADSKYNKSCDFDYLSYLFADLAKYSKAREYFTNPQSHDDGIIPLTKLIVFTEHQSVIRRRGVASTAKNIAFDVQSHVSLLDRQKVDLLPYIFLPLMGSEDYNDEDSEGMFDEVQLLPPDKEREQDLEILKTHLETLLLLTTTKEGRDELKAAKLYPIIRETHLRIEDEAVRDACDRLVQVIMRDEPGDEEDKNRPAASNALEEDEDYQITEIL